MIEQASTKYGTVALATASREQEQDDASRWIRRLFFVATFTLLATMLLSFTRSTLSLEKTPQQLVSDLLLPVALLPPKNQILLAQATANNSLSTQPFLPPPRNQDSLSLLFLRHAKSSWEDLALNDFDRPLAAKGVRAAERLGVFLKEHELPVPDLIISSPSQRTRETLELVQKNWASNVPVQYDERLYALAYSWYFDVYGSLEPSYRRVMLVGHNPAMEATAKYLLNKISDDQFKFSPASFLEMELPNIEAWNSLTAGSCIEIMFVTPKMTEIYS